MFIRKVEVDESALHGDHPVELGYVLQLPVFAALTFSPLEFRAPVTYVLGDNGAGKSTLLEAIAVAMHFNPDGGFLGRRNFTTTGESTHSGLHSALRVSRPENPTAGYFLRAETHYEQVTKLDHSMFYAGAHAHSHGETVMNVLADALGDRGLFIFDEPEAGLSPVSQMAVLGHMALAARKGSQFIVATHSPIIAGVPGADIVVIEEDGIRRTDYEDTDMVRAMREFLDDPVASANYIIGDLAD